MSVQDLPRETPSGPICSRVERLDERRWKLLTQQANAAFARGERDSACATYRRALGVAEALLDQAERGDGLSHAPALLTVSHHNIAEVALSEGLGPVALQHFRAAFERLLRTAGCVAAPSALRQSCASNLQPALIALATHLQTSGASARLIARDIRRARDVVASADRRA